MILLEELDVALGVGADRLGKINRNGMKEVKVHGGVVFEFAADDRVVRPLDLDKIGNALAPIFFGDL